ncbi:MAG TPA: glycosyl hydrolase family 28-related protein, partial [Polyangiaceae bacterium]
MATASLVRSLFFSGATGADGLPIASGSASFYVPGSTSEAVTVYADAAATTPLTQPVALDAAGRAEVYCAVQAEIIIKDAFGVVKRTTTNGNSVQADQVDVQWGGSASTLDAALSGLESNIGAAGNYVESGSTGVVARTLHNVLHSEISPQDFGAVGDGSADDTTALQRAINRAIATNLPLHLRAGAYKITTGLTVNAPLVIFGDGMVDSKIISTAESFDGIAITVPGGSLSNGFEFRDFSVLLAYSTVAGNSAIKFNAGKCASFRRMGLTGTFGIYIGGMSGTDSVIEGCIATVKGSSGTTGEAFVLGDNCACFNSIANETLGGDSVKRCVGFATATGCTVSRCSSTGMATGFLFGNTGDIISGCKATSCLYSFSVQGDHCALVTCTSTTPVTAHVEN